jgi:hypothetical protein
LGAKLGNILKLSEQPPSDAKVGPENIPVDQSSTSLSADSERVRVTVYATFELQ